MLIRLADVKEWLGVPEKQILKWVDAGAIKPVKIEGCRNWYNREQIKKRFGL